MDDDRRDLPGLSAAAAEAVTGEMSAMIGHVVVIDTRSPFVFLGRLQDVRPTFAVLRDTDAHDLRETNTTREAYVLEAVRHGVNVNRSEVWVRWDEVVCVSKLDDVVP